MKHEGWDYLDHMLQTCEELFECMQGVSTHKGLEEDTKTRRAVVMCLLDLGELFKSLSNNELAQYPSESWKNIIGFRNRASHGYHTLNFEIVYNLAAERVPPLYEFLKKKQQEKDVREDDVL